jgi:hypothetical protein
VTYWRAFSDSQPIEEILEKPICNTSVFGSTGVTGERIDLIKQHEAEAGGSDDIICEHCKRELDYHPTYAYPTGMSRVVLGCDGGSIICDRSVTSR